VAAAGAFLSQRRGKDDGAPKAKAAPKVRGARAAPVRGPP
jgi:hypothetical protein